MNGLDQFPSLQAFGDELDALAARDARQVPRNLWQRTAGRRAKARLRLAAGLGALAIVAGGTYAVPITRAAVRDVYSTLSGWISGDDSAAPGHSAGEGLPPWVAAEDGVKRVLARAGDERLVAIRQGDKLTLALAGSAQTYTTEGLREALAGRQIVFIGPGRFIANGRRDRRPVFGLVAAAVKRIQFNYADGTRPVSADGLDGAFGIVIDANRRPLSLAAYDQDGRLIARQALVTDPRELTPGQPLADFRYCPDATRGCPPWPE